MGGAETSLMDLLASVRAAEPGWELHLVLGEEGPLAARAAAAGAAVRTVPIPGSLARLGDSALAEAGRRGVSRLRLAARLVKAAGQQPAYVSRLRQALEDIGPALVHATGFKMQIAGAWATPPAVPLLWHVHDYVRQRPVMRRLMRWHACRCAVVVANSDSVAADVRAVCPARVPVVPIYNAIDLRRFSPLGPTLDLDALAGDPPATAMRIGLVATFARWKGHQVFLKALSLLPPECAVTGYVIGGPIYQTEGSQYRSEELRAQAERLGIARRVRFTGFVDDVPAALRALDVVVHASTRPEPFGMVIAEAMACGKPVVASYDGGAKEIVEPEVNALAHRPGDAVELARQLARLAADPRLREKLGQRGRASVAARFQRERLSAELIRLYRTLVPEARAAVAWAGRH